MLHTGTFALVCAFTHLHSHVALRAWPTPLWTVRWRHRLQTRGPSTLGLETKCQTSGDCANDAASCLTWGTDIKPLRAAASVIAELYDHLVDSIIHPNPANMGKASSTRPLRRLPVTAAMPPLGTHSKLCQGLHVARFLLPL
jgi:hypothetical protein